MSRLSMSVVVPILRRCRSWALYCREQVVSVIVPSSATAQPGGGVTEVVLVVVAAAHARRRCSPAVP